MQINLADNLAPRLGPVVVINNDLARLCKLLSVNRHILHDSGGHARHLLSVHGV